jgi:hypothetical protein
MGVLRILGGGGRLTHAAGPRGPHRTRAAAGSAGRSPRRAGVWPPAQARVVVLVLVLLVVCPWNVDEAAGRPGARIRPGRTRVSRPLFTS